MKINRTTIALATFAATLALGGTTAAFASGGSSGGGGGGGGSATCGGLTVSVLENTLGVQTASWWQPNNTYAGQVVGKTTKACNTNPNLVLRFADLTAPTSHCAPTIPQFIGATYLKYGLKPISNYRSTFYYSTGPDCVGTSHRIQASLIDLSTGALVAHATTTWTV